MIRRPPRSTRTEHSFPTRRSSDLSRATTLFRGDVRMTSSAIEFPVSEDWAKRAWADRARYQDMYDRSIRDAEGFWGEEGKRLDWIKPYTKVKNVSFSGDVHIKWYEDGTLNACYNCVEIGRASWRARVRQYV